MKLAVIADDDNERARRAATEIRGEGPALSLDEADVAVVVGGDGFMLRVLQRLLEEERRLPVYGVNRGTVGFLMNEIDPLDAIRERVRDAEVSELHPLEMRAEDGEGNVHRRLAVNEVTLFRASAQTAKLRVTVDGEVVLDALYGDGVLVSTAAGSTAYNRSAGGPIVPLGARLLALTPLAPFRPRRWRGALLANESRVRLEVRSPEKRPVHATADNRDVRDVRVVDVRECTECVLRVLFDPGHGLEGRILREQFAT